VAGGGAEVAVADGLTGDFDCAGADG